MLICCRMSSPILLPSVLVRSPICSEQLKVGHSRAAVENPGNVYLEFSFGGPLGSGMVLSQLTSGRSFTDVACRLGRL